jgi:hypothetical protein
MQRSDSRRSTTAAELGYRVQAPNTVARTVLAVALDPRSATLGKHFHGQDWPFVSFAGFEGAGPAALERSWRDVLAAGGTDVVVAVASAGHDLEMAREIGTFAGERAVEIGAVLLMNGMGADAASRALCQLRPWARTLTILDDAEYLAGLLHALTR